MINLKEIKNELMTTGYYLLRDTNLDHCEHLMTQVANIVTITHIKCIVGAKRFIESNIAVAYHTDYPVADYIAWYCVQNSDEGGASLIVDIRTLLSELSLNEVKSLSSIHFLINRPEKKPINVPFDISDKYGYEKYYYQPYRLNDSLLDDSQLNALKKFENFLNTTIPIKIDLQKGDFLIINNNFMLHGRSEFKGTDRHLKRFLLQGKEEYLPLNFF
jgi:Taurine catabolism dioxygenase TauD, TfdA family